MERWKICRRYPQYEVSSIGRFRHLGREPRKQYVGGKGYAQVSVSVGKGKHTCVLVHRLVAEAFVPNPDNKPEVNHIDGNKSNNSADNLEWVSSSENKIHAYNSLGVRPWNRKLSDSDVRAIRKDTRLHREIAQDYNIAKSQISFIKRRMIYRDVSDV